MKFDHQSQFIIRGVFIYLGNYREGVCFLFCFHWNEIVFVIVLIYLHTKHRMIYSRAWMQQFWYLHIGINTYIPHPKSYSYTNNQVWRDMRLLVHRNLERKLNTQIASNVYFYMITPWNCLINYTLIGSQPIQMSSEYWNFKKFGFCNQWIFFPWNN